MRFFIITLLGVFLYSFSIISPFSPKISKKYVFNLCKGENISPKIILKDIPKETKSLAITIFDPDAPHGWWHWAVFNIPKMDIIPEKVGNNPNLFTQLINSYGFKGYGGPCPPIGEKHHYVLSVYALKKDKIDIPSNSPIKEALQKIEPFVIKKAQIVGVYKRSFFSF